MVSGVLDRACVCGLGIRNTSMTRAKVASEARGQATDRPAFVLRPW